MCWLCQLSNQVAVSKNWLDFSSQEPGGRGHFWRLEFQKTLGWEVDSLTLVMEGNGSQWQEQQHFKRERARALLKYYINCFRLCEVQGNGSFLRLDPKFSWAPSPASHCIHFHTGTVVPPTFFQKSPQFFLSSKKLFCVAMKQMETHYLCHTSLKQHAARTPAWAGHISTLVYVSWGRPINWKMALFAVRILKTPLVIVNGRHRN